MYCTASTFLRKMLQIGVKHAGYRRPHLLCFKSIKKKMVLRA